MNFVSSSQLMAELIEFVLHKELANLSHPLFLVDGFFQVLLIAIRMRMYGSPFVLPLLLQCSVLLSFSVFMIPHMTARE